MEVFPAMQYGAHQRPSVLQRSNTSRAARHRHINSSMAAVLRCNLVGATGAASRRWQSGNGTVIRRFVAFVKRQSRGTTVAEEGTSERRLIHAHDGGAAAKRRARLLKLHRGCIEVPPELHHSFCRRRGCSRAPSEVVEAPPWLH
ncbi:hypothetical protein VPH35_077666 [Triticum aestivum]